MEEEDGNDAAPFMGLNIGHTALGRVLLAFRQPVLSMDMPPDVARKMGQTLLHHADGADAELAKRPRG